MLLLLGWNQVILLLTAMCYWTLSKKSSRAHVKLQSFIISLDTTSNRSLFCLGKKLKYQVSCHQFSLSVMSDFLQPHESQHARLPCPSPTPGVYSNSHSSSHWCHPAISSSVIPFSSCPQSLPASGSFPMSQLCAWGGQSIGVSALASFLPMNTQDWSPLEWTGRISLQSCHRTSFFSYLSSIWLCLFPRWLYLASWS